MILYDKKEAGKRLTEIIVDSKLNSRQFAISIGGDPSYLSKMEKGDKGISRTYLESMEEKYHINRKWLLYGTGEKYINGHNVPHENGSMVQESQSDIERRRDLKNKTTSVFMVPLVPVKAQAGYAMSYPDTQHFSESLEKYPMLPGISHHGAEWRYFEVEGDSMIPTLFDKDYILVSAVLREDWQDVKPNKPYVVVLHEDVFVKFIYQVDRETWILASANRKVKHKKISVEDVKELWVFRGRTTKNLDIPKIEIKV